MHGWRGVERRCGARLALVGAGPIEAALQAHPYGHRVTFIPVLKNRDTLADVLAALDLYIAAGPLETFGLSAIEAMACGTPVLTVNSSAVLEHMLSGGGFLFERGNLGSLADLPVRLFAQNLSLADARAESCKCGA